MRKFIGITLLVLLIGCSDPLEEKEYYFKPLEFDGNGFVVINSLATKEHYDKVEKVLAFYEIDFQRIDETKIKLTKGLLPEELMNISKKAEDKVWMEQRETVKN